MHLKREIVKYVRDRAKKDYKLDSECKICSTTENLELHHYYTLSLLIERWLPKKKYKPEDVLDWRDEFINEHKEQMFNNVVTLCKFHHQERLHNIFGQMPELNTAKKQENWVNIQKEKYVSMVI